MKIENDQQLGVAVSLIDFARAHNEGVKKTRVRQDINTLLDLLDKKDRKIAELETEINTLNQDIRVMQDLLTLAGAIDDNK